MTSFKRWNNIVGWAVFAIAALVYLMTMEPVSSLWDCSEFIATSYKLEVGHPPGAPLFTQFPKLTGLTANDVYNLFVDRSGNVWIGAVRVGAYRCETAASADRFTLFDKTDRPDLTWSFGVQAMLQDRHGTLWFGFSGGLFRFNGSSFVNVTRGGPWESP